MPVSFYCNSRSINTQSTQKSSNPASLEQRRQRPCLPQMLQWYFYYARYDGGGDKLGERSLLGVANLTRGLADTALPSPRPRDDSPR
jgi:hypothetical protein